MKRTEVAWFVQSGGETGGRPHLVNAFSYVVWFFGCPAQEQKLDLMILMGSFQFSIFYDSVKIA